MKPKFTLHALLAGLVLSAALILPGWAKDTADPSQVSAAVARWLEQGHYTRQKLDDQMSQRLLETYLTALDYNKLYFTQEDVDEFNEKYGTRLDDALLQGNLEPARDIFTRFKTRVQDRVTKNKELAKKDYAFKSDKVVELNRQKSAWPKNLAEADQIWKDRLEAELLQEKLNELKLRSPQETITRRYDQVLRNINEMEDEDVVKAFLSSLAQTYDPHSDYLSPRDMENFQISMKLSLVGVGAVLRSDEGYARVMEVVPGGPADLDGNLKVNDRIAAVAQGDEEFEDVVDMKLDKVVEKIRGKKGSWVRLLVVPGDASDSAKRKIVTIQRDEVKLKEQEAKGELLDLKGENGNSTRIGWISLPLFYADMENRGGKDAKSTTKDVAALIERLKREGMQGLVIDLRRDGGGSLDEAINLTGLFIPRGPVVQSKDSNGKVTVSQDTNPSVAYDGPLIVLMNRMSASASEIFAAALQDYGRAVIVGDERSFGKGSVQTVLELGRLMPFFSMGSGNAGALKLTIQKFYRVKGGSTQLRGVESDIVLPSLTDNPEIGEGSLKNRMNYDEVAPVKIVDGMAATPLFIDELRAKSTERVQTDPEFVNISEDAARIKEKLAKNAVSLNEKNRRTEIAADKQRKEDRKVARSSRGPALDVQAYQLNLDDLAKPELKAVAFDRKNEKLLMEEVEVEDSEKKEDEAPEPDAVRNEALRIMKDLIGLTNNSVRTASTQKPAASE